MDSIKEAQADMRLGYMNGSLGVVVSGSMWLMSGLVAVWVSPTSAIWALLIGGVFIFPLSNLIEKVLGKRGRHTKGNPFGSLAMEGTIWMIMCLPLAYGLSLQRTEWFFQGMLVIIGGRYLTFATVYGLRSYWLLGGLLGLSAYLLFTLKQSAAVSAFTGAAVEMVFGLGMIRLIPNKD